MLIEANQEFADYAEQQYRQQKGERVHCFEYKNKRYWLKQPERLSGIDRLLKPYSKENFQEEVRALLLLGNKRVPVPRLLVATDTYFVLEDAGETLNHLLPRLSAVEKRNVLANVISALTDLHQMNLVHGRPAIRDIAWMNGQIRFIDLENHFHVKDLMWNKMRDILVFLHSLCRTNELNNEDILATIDEVRKQTEPHLMQKIVNFMKNFRWIYYLLLPFKPIAKTDLIALYRLFELFK